MIALLIAQPWSDDTPTDDGTPTGQETVRVRAADYIGDPVEEVEAALKEKGLGTWTNEIDNSGDHEAGTVADLDPTGEVKVGTTDHARRLGRTGPGEARQDQEAGPDQDAGARPRARTEHARHPRDS